MSPTALDRIASRVIRCEQCPRLRRYCRGVAEAKVRRHLNESYWALPVPGFGDPKAKLLIVGLAPAAHGANRTGRMFTGDSSGDWLYEALHRFGFANQPTSTGRDDGLRLISCYIAASARCAPPDNKPTPRELERCRQYMIAELEVLDQVRVVVTLGRIAHQSYLRAAGWWSGMAPRDRPEFGHDRLTRLPNGLGLVSSFHPSRQNTNTGKLTRAMWHGVFARVRDLVDGKAEIRSA